MNPLLDIQDLHVTFATSKGMLHAVRGIDFAISPGEVVGIVGESGSGKSAALKALTQLNPKHGTSYEGKILYNDKNLLELSEREMRSVRGKEISMIFQDPMTSLNPTMTIGGQIIEGYKAHFTEASTVAAKQKAVQLLSQVGIASAAERFDNYPHELSGGMRQRVMIALALACEPKLLLADEPTTALDVTTQAQILDLLRNIQKEMGMALILVTHDLGVVATFCDRILVMYGGKIVESAATKRLFEKPEHPYTERLIKAIPTFDQDPNTPLPTIVGTPPNLLKPVQGCSFCPRCPDAMHLCTQNEPPLFPVGKEHASACFNHHPEKPQ